MADVEKALSQSLLGANAQAQATAGTSHALRGLGALVVLVTSYLVVKLGHLVWLCPSVAWALVPLLLGDVLLTYACLFQAPPRGCLRRLAFAVGLAAFGLTLVLTWWTHLESAAANRLLLESVPGYPTGVTAHIEPGSGTVRIVSHSSEPSDIYFVQGLVSAQMRTFQLELQRRIGTGTLSALVGKPALDQDRLFRTLGFGAQAAETFAKLRESGRFETEIAALVRFADGVNAYFGNADLFHAPLELMLLAFVQGRAPPATLAAWTPEHSLVWSLMMSFDLCGNLARELQRFQLLVQHNVSRARIGELLPRFDLEMFPTVLDAEDVCDGGASPRDSEDACLESDQVGAWLDSLQAKRPAAAKPASGDRELGALRAGGNIFRTHGASNNWVVGGAHTASGRPLLANDPHLDLSAPSVWLLFSLENAMANETAVGAGLVGIPGIIIGRTANIAWGVTNTGADVQDLFVLNMVNETHYRHGNGTHALVQRREVVHISGADAPLELVVREAPHYGPVLGATEVATVLKDPHANLGDHVLALRWRKLPKTSQGESTVDTTSISFMRNFKAKNLDELRDSLALLTAPGQNFVMANATDIGYQMTGLLPVRRPGHTGLFPAPGDGSADWAPSALPFDQMPHVLNPRKGFVVTANNQVQPACARVTPTCDWDGDGFRARRITELIRKGGSQHSIATMQAIQLDLTSSLARDLRPALAAACEAPRVRESEPANVVCERLLHWDAGMEVGREEPALFSHWTAHLMRAAGNETGMPEWRNLVFIERAFRGPAGLGAAASPNVPRCAQALSQAECADWAVESLLQVAAANAAGRIPPWGAGEHDACFASAVFDTTPFRCLFSRSIPHGGDPTTVNVGGFALPSFQQRAGPSYREVISFEHADLSGSVFQNGLGQHGSPVSPLYDNLLTPWAEGRFSPMR